MRNADHSWQEFILWCIALVVFALMSLLLNSCGAAAKLQEPKSVDAPFCFALNAEREGKIHYLLACSDTLDLCDYTRQRAVSLSSLAYFTEIGACHVVRD